MQLRRFYHHTSVGVKVCVTLTVTPKIIPSAEEANEPRPLEKDDSTQITRQTAGLPIATQLSEMPKDLPDN